MKKPNATQLEAARRLVAHEVYEGPSGETVATAAARVHQKIFARLATLLGAGGARALFARSVKLTVGDFPCLRTMDLDEKPMESLADQLAACLRDETQGVAAETAVALCAAVLNLLSTLIGERLTFQVLRSAWPTFDVSAPAPKKEEKE